MRFRFALLVWMFILAGIAKGQNAAQGDVIVHTPPGLDALFHKKTTTGKTDKKKNTQTASELSKPSITEKKEPGDNIKAEAGKPVTEGNKPLTDASKPAMNSKKPANEGKTPEAVPKLVTYDPKAPAASQKTKNDYVRLVSNERQGKVIYSGKGYRVQIYYGPDRNKALKIKTDFMHNFPGMRTYLTYLPPNFRVKVGNYRNRSDALGMFKEANSIYYPSMIVPDIITISTF